MTVRPLTSWRVRLQEAVRFARQYPEAVVARTAVLSVLVWAAIFFVVPLYWLFSTSFRGPETMAFPPDLVPTDFTVVHFAVVLSETAFIDTYLVNSLIVSAATVALTVGIATPAGYALSRYSLPYETYLLVSLLFVQMIPIVAMVIPLYRMFSVAGILNTLTAIVLADTALAVPIATWLIKGYYDTVPEGLEEAALVGGASHLQSFRVIAPLARPAIGTSAIYAFVISWNQFVIPLTFAPSRTVWTVPVGLYEFISRHGVVQWGLLGAASVIAMLPVVVLFLVFQRQFVAGLAGAGFRGG